MRVAGRELLASAGDDRTVRIWDPATGPPEQTLDGHTDWVRGGVCGAVAGRELLASAGDDRTRADLGPGHRNQPSTPSRPHHGVNTVCGARGGPGTARLRQRRSRPCGSGTRPPEPPSRPSGPHRRGEWGMCGAGRAGNCSPPRAPIADVRIWDPATGTTEQTLHGHTGWVWEVCAVRVAGRELLASASDDHSVRIWDPATGAAEPILKGHTGWMWGVCAARVAGRELLASASDDGTVRIWDPATGAVEQTLHRAHRLGAGGVCGAGGGPGAARLHGRRWHRADLGSGHRGRRTEPCTGHTGWVWGVCAVRVAGRELLASTGADRSVRIWDPATPGPSSRSWRGTPTGCEGCVRCRWRAGSCSPQPATMAPCGSGTRPPAKHST